jgi:hypothetical protein
MNSSWVRGYGDPPPQTVIVVGLPLDWVGQYFQSCKVAGQITNSFDIDNEETTTYPTIAVCRGLRKPWQDIWKNFLRFG